MVYDWADTTADNIIGSLVLNHNLDGDSSLTLYQWYKLPANISLQKNRSQPKFYVKIRQ